MAESNGNGGAQVVTPPTGAPALNAMVQFTKDFSFENPNAPRSLGPQDKPPNISIQVNVNAKQLAETDFEVNIMLEGSAGQGAETLFKFELDYAGVFRVGGIPALMRELSPLLDLDVMTISGETLTVLLS